MPVTMLKDEDLRLKMGHSIGETLKQKLGITNQSFGPGVGTPVIRGQTRPRVRVLTNGIGSNDASSISPDHATSVEPLLADRVEVLRGLATLLYGSGAMGGVVNLIDNRIPGFMFGGAVEQRYDSVPDETSTALKAEGGRDEFAYHLEGFYRERNNMDIGGRGIDIDAVRITDPSLTVVQNPKVTLPNTWAMPSADRRDSPGSAIRILPGCPSTDWKATTASPPDGTGEEIVRINLRQSKYDFKSELANPFSFAKALHTRLGYTDYQHTEIAVGERGAFFTNKSLRGPRRTDPSGLGAATRRRRIQGHFQRFQRTEKLIGEAIVPRSQINSYGVFAVESFDMGPVTYQLGARVEETTIDPESVKGLSYTRVSASASALWKIDASDNLNLAITHSSRAPQVQELPSNGFHDATRSFEIGDIKLKEETSYNLDLGCRFKSDWMRAEFDLFRNWASDYIFQQRTGQFVDEDGNPCVTDCVPVVTSAQGDAI